MKTFAHTAARISAGLTTLAILVIASAAEADAQRRDFMSEAEIEIVRDSQDIDVRIDVLVRMMDRRFTLLGVDTGGWKERPKDLEKWGEPPTGSRLDLITDIRKLLVKAVDDLDVIAQRSDDALKQNQTEGKLFPKAVRTLDSAAQRYMVPLTKGIDTAANEAERGQYLNIIALCEEIIEAAKKLPADAAK
ncbi:MAG TPA: hypothetical protein VK918_10180 [Pyrinomonadaceae bacterium]|nr:hypothetical protein [Pyrinomonadaceae bacterium]